MGRSVSCPPNAGAIAYDYIDMDEDWDEYDWQDLEEDALYGIRELFPSMEPASGWAGREDKIIARNGHAIFGMSEYCRLIAYWMVPEDRRISEAWVAQVAPRFQERFARLARLGVMSNGEAVYQRLGV